MNQLINILIVAAFAALLAVIGPALDKPQKADGPCGPNAAWVEIDKTTIQCLNKKGRKTVKVQIDENHAE